MHRITVNSAHAESGYTCLAFSRDGSKIYTGGAEGYVRIWKTELGDTQEPDVAAEGEEGITSIATSFECWLSGSLDACVRVYDADKSTMRGLVTRTVAVPVRCVAVDPKGQRVAVASDELEIRIIDLNNTSDIQKLEGHRKGVRKVTWHPSGTILTSSGCDGDIIAWDVPVGGENKRIETVTGLLPIADPESPEYVYDSSCVWHPSGNYFLVATRTHEIVSISKENWQKSLTFSSDLVTGAITALALSQNGTYLASATAAGIFIWSTVTRKVLFQYTPGANFSLASHVAFSPTENLLAWTDADATLTRWSEPILPSFPDPVKSHLSSTTAPKPMRKKTDILGLDDDSIQKAPQKMADDNYGIDDDDWIIDDIGLLDNPDKEPRIDGVHAKEMGIVTKAQPAFQPASTPMVNKKRYLAYNMIGVIEVTDQDTHNVVNVEFHDRSTRMSSHFQDVNKCDMASLGERGALYACPKEGDHPAQIMYKPYSAWGSSGEWDCSLPPGENVVALAAGGSSPSKTLRTKSSDGDIEGNGNVIVATSRGYIRFFSGGGVQQYIWNLAADVISMVAQREWVFIIHRDGGTSLDGCQNLSYSLIAFDTFNILQAGRLPIPRGATLKWIGITEEGAPAIYDSNGLLSILDRFRRPTQARWVPLLETTSLARRQGKDESYWPVGVSGALFMCIILKGREEYPGFPRPLIQEIEVQMPIYSLDEPQGRIEERILREKVYINFLRDGLGGELNEDVPRRELNIDKELIQLIQLTCKNEQLQKALDLVALLHNVSSFDLAVKVAEFYHLTGLKIKIQLMKQDRIQQEGFQGSGEKEILKELALVPAPRRPQLHHVKPRLEAFSSSTTVRKSLAPAIPIAPSFALSDDVDIDNTFTETADPPLTWDALPNDKPITAECVEPNKKRKDSDVFENDNQSASKKRILSTTETTSNATSSNPFAKKNHNNPFSRPVPTKSNETTRSNSFFEKIEEPRSKNGAQKPKQKTASRQTTLFDLASGSGVEKKSSVTTKIQNDVGATSKSPALPDSNIQPTNVTLPAVVDGHNPNSSIDCPVDEDNEDIEWPESPPRISKKLET